MKMNIKNPQIPLIIPAYEPDERMVVLVQKLSELYPDNIVIVNDGSGQEYEIFFKKVQELGCIVLKHYRNMGKGRGLKNAFNYCLNQFPDMTGCITADSDGQHSIEDILKIREALVQNPEKLVLGVRNFSGDDIPFKSRFGNRLTVKVCKFLCGMEISDTQTGLRGIPKAFMAELLDTKGERFEFEMQMLLESKNCYPIEEVTIKTLYDSMENHQTHFDPIRDSIRIYSLLGAPFLRFLVSSVSSSVLDIILFSILCTFLKNFMGIAYIAVATAGARILSAIYNFIINYRLVFKSDEKYNRAMLKYFILVLCQMAASAFFVTLFCVLIKGINETLAKIIVDTILFFISYQIQQNIVFIKQEKYD